LELVRRLHPDRVGPQGTALFQQITEAYEHLADQKKRRAYDRSRAPETAPRPAITHRHDSWGDVEPLTPHRTPIVDAPAPIRGPGLEHVYEWLTVPAWGPGNPQGFTDDLELEVLLTPREASHGAVLPLVVPVVEDCPWCGGLGRTLLPCLRCGGRGEVVRQQVSRIRIPANLRDGSVIEIPLAGLRIGWRNLRLHVRTQRRSH